MSDLIAEALRSLPDLLTVGEVSALMRVHHATTYKAIRDGRLASVRLAGGRFRIPKAAVADAITQKPIAEPLQSTAAHAEQPLCDGDGAGQPVELQAGAPLPAVLTDTQLASLVGFGLTQFYRRKKLGEFAFLELRPQLPRSNTLYSGALVTCWLQGETVIGGPAARTFFGAARQRNQAVAMRVGRRPGRPKRSAHVGSVGE